MYATYRLPSLMPYRCKRDNPRRNLAIFCLAEVLQISSPSHTGCPGWILGLTFRLCKLLCQYLCSHKCCVLDNCEINSSDVTCCAPTCAEVSRTSGKYQQRIRSCLSVITHGKSITSVIAAQSFTRIFSRSSGLFSVVLPFSMSEAYATASRC